MSLWDEVPDVGALVPDGTYVVDIEDIEKGQSREMSKLLYSPVMRIVEPVGYADMPLYDNFTIGSKDDPGAESEETWKASIGARRFKQLVKASQVQLDGIDPNAAPEDQADQTIEYVRGQQIVVSVEVETDSGENDPKFKGRKRNRITGYYPLGTREAAVAEATQAPTARSPMPRPGAPKPSTARLGPRAAVAPTAPPPSTRPSVRPGPRPAPPPPVRAAGRPAATAPASKPIGKKPQMIECSECVQAGLEKGIAYPDGALVSRADFPAHIDAHSEE